VAESARRGIAQLSVLGLLCCSASGVAALEDGAWYLDLDEAIAWRIHSGLERRGERHVDATRGLTCEVRLRDGKAEEEVWAFVPEKPGSWFRGRLEGVERGEDSWSAIVTLRIPHMGAPPGGPVLGGAVRFRVRLARGEDGWSGTHEGRCTPSVALDDHEAIRRINLALQITEALNNPTDRAIRAALGASLREAEVAGAVAVRGFPLPRRDREPFDVEPGEHPRLLFTRRMLDRIRANVATPEGAEMFARIEELMGHAHEHGFGFHMPHADHSMQSLWAVAEGFMYHLTGDEEHLRRAQRYTRAGMYGVLPNLSQWRQSYRIMGVALAYDLCADGWDRAFKQDVQNYLLEKAREFTRRMIYRDPLNVAGRYSYGGQTTNWVDAERRSTGYEYLTAAGLAALAVAGDELLIYRPPDPKSAETVPPDADFAPLPGVPVVELKGAFFDRWLVNGPFDPDDDDPLAEIGGFAGARPIPGTTLRVNGVDLDFRAYQPSGLYRDPYNPSIYPRNCAQYWTSSTGNGYWPGKKVMQTYDRKAVRLCMYTVWKCEEAQYVQAFPNMYWHGHGYRMWLAGREVRDEEIVRVEPGYYPVMVYYPSLAGGYNNSAPHLRHYSVEQYEEEMRRYRERRRLLEEGGDIAAILAESVARELRYHALVHQGPDGWQSFGYSAFAMPFFNAWLDLTGENLASDTGYEHVVPVAIAQRNFGHPNADVHLAQSFPFLSRRDRGLARWYLQRYTVGTRRPLELVVALATMDPEVPVVEPAEHLSLVNHFPHASTVTFNNDFARTDLDEKRHPDKTEFQVRFETAEHDPLATLGIDVQGIRPGKNRQTWIYTRGGDRLGRLGEASMPFVEGFYNLRPGRRLHAEFGEDGSGVTSYELRDLVPGRRWVHEGNGRTYLTLGKKPRVGSSILRSLLVDYSGDAGVPVLLVTADRFRGFADNEVKVTQLRSRFAWSESTHPHGQEQSEAHAEQNRFRLFERHERKLHSIFAVRAFCSRDMWLKEIPMGDGPGARQGRYQFRVDAPREGDAREQERLLERLDGELDEDLIAELAELAEGDLDTRELEEGQERPGDVYIYTVMRVQQGEAPEIEVTGKGVDTVIRVGDVALGFDGTRLHRR